MTSPMLGSRVHTRLPWSQCHCGCGAGSRSRKAERKMQRRIEKAATQRQMAAEWPYAGGV